MYSFNKPLYFLLWSVLTTIGSLDLQTTSYWNQGITLHDDKLGTMPNLNLCVNWSIPTIISYVPLGAGSNSCNIVSIHYI